MTDSWRTPARDHARFPLAPQGAPCWICDANEGEVRVFMGRFGHVSCIQRQAAPTPGGASQSAHDSTSAPPRKRRQKRGKNGNGFVWRPGNVLY